MAFLEEARASKLRPKATQEQPKVGGKDIPGKGNSKERLSGRRSMAGSGDSKVALNVHFFILRKWKVRKVK